MKHRTAKTAIFQSTLPARGATPCLPRGGQSTRLFQSTLPARGATELDNARRMGKRYFNPRSPRGERRAIVKHRTAKTAIFQSTLPARGATRCASESHSRTGYFNPRSPRGERQIEVAEINESEDISIHAPREGSDFEYAIHKGCWKEFQSTLPARGATSG